MRKALRFVAAMLAALAGLGIAAFSAALWLGDRKLERAVDVRVVPVAFARDPQAVRSGRELFASRGCAECHGADGGGRLLIDDRATGMRVRTPNLTPGANGVTRGYGEADWVRAIRHGVSPAGRALLVMPSEDFNALDDTAFAALVAYVRSLPPVPGEPAEVRMPMLMKALYGTGAMRDAAEKIDHRRPPAAATAPAPAPTHGNYVAGMCVACHGAPFAGGRIPGGPENWPAASNLTPPLHATYALLKAPPPKVPAP